MLKLVDFLERKMSMESKGLIRALLLLRYLFQNSDETHPVSAGDILAYWESRRIHSDRRRVYHDIALLQEFGIDIVCVKSKQNQYFMGNRLFELPELKLLVDAVESSRFITKKKSDVLIHKLASLASQTEAVQLTRPVYMDGTAKPENETIYYVVDVIHTAIQKKQQIEFQYIEYTPEKKKILKHGRAWYRFSPYALMWQQDYYYAVGHSMRHGKLVQFRVDRMVNAKLAEEPAVSTSDFCAADYAAKVFGMYPDDLQTVTLLCENHLMRSVIDRFGESVQTETVDDGHFRATVEVAPSPPFFAWVFTFWG